MSLTITNDNFKKEVLESDRPVLLDFWAPWCGPCRMMTPVVDEISNEQNAVKVGKVNIDEQEELAEKFGIMTIPTLMLIKNGKVESSIVGVKSKKAVLNLLEK